MGAAVMATDADRAAEDGDAEAVMSSADLQRWAAARSRVEVAGAIGDITACHHVTAVDPVWGRDDVLWEVVAGFAAGRT